MRREGVVADQNISWQTVAGVVAIVGLMAGITQTQFTNVKDAATDDRAQVAILQNELVRFQDHFLSKDEHKAYLDGTKTEFGDIKARIIALEQEQKDLVTKLAHEPVEQKTVDAINAAVAKEVDQIQSQITDINRQIAAALIIIDNNGSAPKRGAVPNPP
jgi:hypothetical protein